jgi:type III pantothenate kinase
MLLTIDIGNTNTVIGVFAEGRLKAHWRLSTGHMKTIDEAWVNLGGLFKSSHIPKSQISGVVIGSVVPDVTWLWQKLAENYLRQEPLIVRHDTPGVPDTAYDDPSTLGIDRVCNVVAAWELFHGPAIVVDFGTATTIDIGDAGGRFIGGLILPGLGTAMRDLHIHAARLPKVQLEYPERLIGRNTVNAMQSGILYGTVAMVAGLVQKLQAELAEEGHTGEFPVISTGGFGGLIRSRCPVIRAHYPYLVLYGLATLHGRANGTAMAIQYLEEA